MCWQGGLITYTAKNIDAVNAATANFAANNIDPKAAIITVYNFIFGHVSESVVVLDS